MNDDMLADLIPHYAQRRHLLIGQAPQREPKTLSPDWRPWDSDSGRRLAKMMGLSHERMMDLFDTANLNVNLKGTKGKYDLFDMVEARQRATAFLHELANARHLYDLVLCAGKRVLILMQAPQLAVRENEPVSKRIAGIPHPGGTNRWYNDPSNRAEAHAFLAELGRTL